MKIHPSLIACEHCDSVYRRPTLARGEVATCQRCGATLQRHATMTVDQWLALSIATFIVFLGANIYPSLRIGMEGFYNEATLLQAAWALSSGYAAAIAIPAVLVAVGVPFVQLTLLIWVLAFARFARPAPGLALAARTLFHLRQWSMVEVALVGVLITMVKLSGTLHVQPLAGLWAIGLSMMGLTLVTNQDRAALWDLADVATPFAEKRPA